MAAYSPLGLFVELPQATLDNLRASALAAMTSGRRVSMSGGQKSGTKEWQMLPQEMLAEVNYAEQQNGTKPARGQKVVQVLTAWPPVQGSNNLL